MISSSCFGECSRLRGQNRAPTPPAMINAYASMNSRFLCLICVENGLKRNENPTSVEAEVGNTCDNASRLACSLQSVDCTMQSCLRACFIKVFLCADFQAIFRTFLRFGRASDINGV
jgi:hypothetical protein